VVIKNHYEPTYSLRITIESGDTNVGKLKCIVQEQHKGNPAVQDQLLVFRGKLLDSKTTLFNLLKSSNLADENTPCMYIHMTLRGGSGTATKIGLNSTSSNSQAPSQHTQPSPPAQTEQKAEAAMTEAEEEEEEKCVQPATSSASPPVSSRARAPVHAYPHPPHHHPHHPAPPYPYAAASAHPYPYPYPPPYAHAYPYGVMPPPPPPPGSLPPAPHAMAFSQSMPDLMAPPHMYRQSSAPSHPSHQTFAPPTLVQQTSNPSQPSSSSSSSSHPPPPAVPYPYPPPWPYAHPHLHPHAHAHPSAPPMPPYGLHAYSTSDLYHPRDPRIRSAKKKKHSKISSTISQIRETTTTEDDQKFVHADADHNVPAPALAVDQIDDNGNRQPFRGLYGLRQRGGHRERAAAAVNDNVAVAANENNAANANENNNNANANAVVNAANNNNNNNVVPRDGIMVRLFRLLNVNVLIRLAIFMWLFGPNLGTNRFSILCVMGGLYYLHQVGVLHAVLNRFGIGRNRNANEPQHRDPNAAAAADDVSEEEHSAPPPPPSRLTHAQLLQRFLVGLVASLWPTWDHRTLYPAVRQ